MKINELKVKKFSLKKHGAVSYQIAKKWLMDYTKRIIQIFVYQLLELQDQVVQLKINLLINLHWYTYE